MNASEEWLASLPKSWREARPSRCDVKPILCVPVKVRSLAYKRWINSIIEHHRRPPQAWLLVLCFLLHARSSRFGTINLVAAIQPCLGSPTTSRSLSPPLFQPWLIETPLPPSCCLLASSASASLPLPKVQSLVWCRHRCLRLCLCALLPCCESES